MDPAGEAQAWAEEEKHMNTWDPFDRPRPTIDCLLHEAVLVQAWKKSHAYIRSRNWYADVLELDHSAAALPELIKEWGEPLYWHQKREGPRRKDPLNALRPQPLRVVPAPKSYPWTFSKEADTPEWHPDEKAAGKPFHLRPLAHLDMRSQTLYTALMICLADVVESRQGNTELPLNQARKIGVVSYGNRLLCDFGDDGEAGATFRWGNASSYRKYFTDYEKFLERPKAVCREHLPVTKGKQLGVVSLDLKGFFERVTSSDVLHRLETLCSDQAESDTDFWRAATRITKWRWDERDQHAYAGTNVFENALEQVGQPQGGVASGFFSNVAMLDFDEGVTAAIREDRTIFDGVEILDYCRYVDDLRLVVRHDESSETQQVQSFTERWIQSLLGVHTVDQQLNTNKSSYLSAAGVEGRGTDSLAMRSIQSAISGPMDTGAMEDASLLLQGLLNSVDDVTAEDIAPESSLALEKIHKPAREIRDDTIVRFVAHRQVRLLRDRRDLAAGDTPAKAIEVQAEIDSAVKKLIHHWSHDPSLTVVLRGVLDLMPQISTLKAVLEAMEPYLDGQGSSAERMAVYFCLGDLLTGTTTKRYLDADSAEVDPGSDEFNQLLADTAIELLKREDTPWHLMQQAAMAGLSLGHEHEVFEVLSRTDLLVPETALYQQLALVMSGRLEDVRENQSWTSCTATVAVALQLDRHSKARRSIKRFIETLERSSRNEAIDRLTEWMPELAIASSPKTLGRDSSSIPSGFIPLTDVIQRSDNPFATEQAALRLVEAVLTSNDFPTAPHLDEGVKCINVSCKDYYRLSDMDPAKETVELKINFDVSEEASFGKLRSLPAWAQGKRRWMMFVGMIARAAFIGRSDYTAYPRDELSPARGYRGIRSSQFKRQYGMLHRPDGLAGPDAACSTWWSDFLTQLLAWPGATELDRSSVDLSSVVTIKDLGKIMKKQLKTLQSQYASASGMPVYEYTVGQNIAEDDRLTVALVQTVRPFRGDFAKFGIQLNDPRYRTIRRD